MSIPKTDKPPADLMEGLTSVTTHYLTHSRDKHAPQYVILAALSVAASILAGHPHRDQALEFACKMLRDFTELASDVFCPDCEKDLH